MLRKIKSWFKPNKETLAETGLTIQLLQMLDVTHEDELSCGEVHELVDQYVELKQRGEDVERLMPLVKHHLDMCRECFEEYEALLAALELAEAL